MRSVTTRDANSRSVRVTALSAYLESVGRLAAEATERGDVVLAQELLAQAMRVASRLPSAAPVTGDVGTLPGPQPDTDEPAVDGTGGAPTSRESKESPQRNGDAGNSTKSQAKHGFSTADVESLLDAPVLFAGRIVEPPHEEARYLLLGVTAGSRRAA